METVYEVACFTKENETTKQIIEVALWNRGTFSDEPVVIVSSNEGVASFCVRDIPALISLLNSVFEEISLIKNK